MSSFVTNLKTFTLHPQRNYLNQDAAFNTKVSDTLKAAALYIGLAILSFILVFCLIKVLDHWYGIDLLKIRAANMKTVFNGPYKILLVALIGPLVEETMCRLWLSFRKVHVAISLLAIALVISVKANGASLYTGHINVSYLLYLIEAMALAGILFTVMNAATIKTLAQQNFKIIYYCSCIGFGLLHILNFAPFKWGIIWAYPLFTLPQIILGFIIGYVRLKNGFAWGVLLHCFINLGLSFFHQ